ncbi:MAG: hypothetical protein KIT09_08555 [Bryobacteraceae bacterium]|nr:hypothetical protein [Bryobacteraceae bacterium]
MRRGPLPGLVVCLTALLTPAGAGPLYGQVVRHVAAGGNLQEAIDQAQPGDTITLESGASYTGTYRLRVKPGNSFITITTAGANAIVPPDARITPADAAALAKIVTPDGGYPAIATDDGAHHYRLAGLEIAGAPGVYPLELIALGSASAADPAQLAHNIELDRLYIHGDASAGGKRAIGLNSGAATIKHCWISDFRSAWQDAQTIVGWNGPGPFTIVNNYLEASGQNVFFGAATPKIHGLVPSDIVIRGNYVRKPAAWKSASYRVANLLELKNARRVLVEANVFENNWTGLDPVGYAIAFNVRTHKKTVPWAVVEDITFVKNIVRSAPAAIQIAGKDNTDGGLGSGRRILVKDNLFHDIDHATWGGAGRLFEVSWGAEDVTFDHNTCLQRSSAADLLRFEGDPLVRFTFMNNIATHGVSGVSGPGLGIGIPALQSFAPNGVFRRNALIGARSGDYPPGNDSPADIALIRFADPAAGDYSLASNSPYKKAATDGKDLGADLGAVVAATKSVFDPEAQRPRAPSADSMSPSAGSGLTQTFQLLFSDGNGAADIGWAFALFNATLAQAGGCYVQWRPAVNSIWLRDDAGAAWLGPVTPGSSGALANRQCAIHPAASSAAAKGSTLTLNLTITFSTSFVGQKNIYLYASDYAGLASGWALKGSWLPFTNLPPVAVSVSPPSGAAAKQTFQFVFSDPNGAGDIAMAYMLFHTALLQSKACYVRYAPATNQFWLRDDPGAAWLGPVTAGLAGTLGNTHCALRPQVSSASYNGALLTVALALTFDPAFKGRKNVYSLAVESSGAASDWKTAGTWDAPGRPPTVDTPPISGFGAANIFQFAFSDPDGAEDLAGVYALFNQDLNGAKACYVYYKPAANELYLRNDTGDAWGSPMAPGSTGLLRNKQCSIDASLSSSSASGTSRTLNLAVVFSAGFGGQKRVYLLAIDKTNAQSEWQARGTWQVPGISN